MKEGRGFAGREQEASGTGRVGGLGPREATGGRREGQVVPRDADQGPGGPLPPWRWLYGAVVAYGVAAILLLAFLTWLAERWVS